MSRSQISYYLSLYLETLENQSRLTMVCMACQNTALVTTLYLCTNLHHSQFSIYTTEDFTLRLSESSSPNSSRASNGMATAILVYFCTFSVTHQNATPITWGSFTLDSLTNWCNVLLHCTLFESKRGGAMFQNVLERTNQVRP